MLIYNETSVLSMWINFVIGTLNLKYYTEGLFCFGIVDDAAFVCSSNPQRGGGAFENKANRGGVYFILDEESQS